MSFRNKDRKLHQTNNNRTGQTATNKADTKRKESHTRTLASINYWCSTSVRHLSEKSKNVGKKSDENTKPIFLFS